MTAVCWSLLLCLVSIQVMMASTASSSEKHCCDFVKHSVTFQHTLGERVKQANGRKVYLFDSTGFAAQFQDQSTTDNIRYKTGMLQGAQVDAVLSVSAQQTVSGQEGAKTYSGWLGTTGLHIDEFGVYI